MKIRELRFKNLNSLYGEWSIDFSEPAYEINGIFAITGPTGSGKSTLLDAVCLALYGETPRLGKLTKSGNEIMSRRTGECFAEVTFEGRGGVYRCHWSQHRAKKSALGTLSETRHEIADALTGKILESKKRETALAVEARTGMDFTRFTRSILLAQGSFDSFLRSGSDSRAPILEQITGTEIYSRISMEVHERLRREQNEQDRLAAEISTVLLLDQDDLVLLEKKLNQQEEEEKKTGEELARLNGVIQWLENMEQLESGLKALELEKNEIEKKEHLFMGQGETLKRAQKAFELEGLYASLISWRQQLENNRSDLLKAREEIPLLEKEKDNIDAGLTGCQRDLTSLRLRWDREKKVFEQIREKDRQAFELRKSRIEGINERDGLEKKCQDFQKEKADLEKKKDSLNRQIQDLESWINKTRREMPAFEDLGTVSQLIEHIEHLRKEKVSKESALMQIEEETRDLYSLLKRSQEEKDEAVLSLNRIQEQKESALKEKETCLGGRALAEIRREKEGLLREQALINHIHDLEEERLRLEEGKPCPLCGAREHPFTRGAIPVPDEKEKQISSLTLIIDRAEKEEQHLADLLEEAHLGRDLLAKIDARLSEIKSKEAHLRARNESLAADILNICARLQEQEERLLLALSPLNLSVLPDKLIPFFNGLKDKQEQLKKSLEEQGEFRKKTEEITSSVQSYQALFETHSSLLNEKIGSLLILEGKLEEVLAKRQEMGGQKNPDQEEELLRLMVLEQERKEQNLLLGRETLLSRIKEKRLFIMERENNLLRGEQERDQLHNEFLNGLGERDFSGEVDFLASRLSATERESLISQGDDLKKRRLDWHTRQREKSDSLRKERDKKLTVHDLDTLVARRSEASDTLKALGRELGSGKEQLERDKKMREGLKEKQQALEKQRLECRRWDNLHSLIGSADGKKYRNIAQGITFELMVGHANRQLMKMSDRYLLIRDESSPLDLNVIDNYQAGEIRSTRNLSGGEGFIVSLSLALGLSQMASQKVPVDSLFLDEGFGTLDEEALDMALETLSGLRQEGKLIGVISHIPALKERIRCQLSLQPLSGGKSLLMGPGVVKRG